MSSHPLLQSGSLYFLNTIQNGRRVKADETTHKKRVLEEAVSIANDLLHEGFLVSSENPIEGPGASRPSP